MNKMLVWVAFPFGVSVLLLLLIFMLNEAGAEGIKYKSVKTESGAESRIGYVDKKPGTGAEVKQGDKILLSFLMVAGKAVPRKNPEPWSVGAGDFGPGLDEGIIGMKEGGVREIIIPPELMREEMMRGGGGEMVFEVQVFKIMPDDRGMPFKHP